MQQYHVSAPSNLSSWVGVIQDRLRFQIHVKLKVAFRNRQDISVAVAVRGDFSPYRDVVLVATGAIGQSVYIDTGRLDGRTDGHLRSGKRNFLVEALEKGWQARRGEEEGSGERGRKGGGRGRGHQLPTFPQSRSTLTTEWPEQVARSAHTLENERG